MVLGVVYLVQISYAVIKNTNAVHFSCPAFVCSRTGGILTLQNALRREFVEGLDRLTTQVTQLQRVELLEKMEKEKAKK